MRFQLHYLKQAVFSKFLNMRIYTLLVVQAFLIYLFMTTNYNFFNNSRL